jgi:hypothetical protein
MSSVSGYIFKKRYPIAPEKIQNDPPTNPKIAAAIAMSEMSMKDLLEVNFWVQKSTWSSV